MPLFAVIPFSGFGYFQVGVFWILQKKDLTELALDKRGAVPLLDPFGLHTLSNPSGGLHTDDGQRNAVDIHH